MLQLLAGKKVLVWPLLLLRTLMSPHSQPICCSAGSEYKEASVLLPQEREIWQVPHMLYFSIVLLRDRVQT